MFEKMRFSHRIRQSLGTDERIVANESSENVLLTQSVHKSPNSEVALGHINNWLLCVNLFQRIGKNQELFFYERRHEVYHLTNGWEQNRSRALRGGQCSWMELLHRLQTNAHRLRRPRTPSAPILDSQVQDKFAATCGAKQHAPLPKPLCGPRAYASFHTCSIAENHPTTTKERHKLL